MLTSIHRIQLMFAPITVHYFPLGLKESLVEPVYFTSLSCLSQANDIMSNYQTGVLENSAKMVLLFHLIDESVMRRDKILVFR